MLIETIGNNDFKGISSSGGGFNSGAMGNNLGAELLIG